MYLAFMCFKHYYVFNTAVYLVLIYF